MLWSKRINGTRYEVYVQTAALPSEHGFIPNLMCCSSCSLRVVLTTFLVFYALLGYYQSEAENRGQNRSKSASPQPRIAVIGKM